MIIVPILQKDENQYLGSWSVFLKNKQLISGKAGIGSQASYLQSWRTQALYILPLKLILTTYCMQETKSTPPGRPVALRETGGLGTSGCK